MMKLYILGHLTIFVRSTTYDSCGQELQSFITGLKNDRADSYAETASLCSFDSPEVLRELPTIWDAVMRGGKRDARTKKAQETLRFIEILLYEDEPNDSGESVKAGSRVCRYETFDDTALSTRMQGAGGTKEQLKYFRRVLTAVTLCTECRLAVSMLYEKIDIIKQTKNPADLSVSFKGICDDLDKEDVQNIWESATNGKIQELVAFTLKSLKEIVKVPPSDDCVISLNPSLESLATVKVITFPSAIRDQCFSSLNRGQTLIVYLQSLSISSNPSSLNDAPVGSANPRLAPLPSPTNLLGIKQVPRDFASTTVDAVNEIKDEKNQAAHAAETFVERPQIKAAAETAVVVAGRIPSTGDSSQPHNSPDDPSELTEIINRMMKMAENVNDYATKVSEIGVTAAHAATLVQVLASLGELASRCLDQMDSIEVNTGEIDIMIGLTLAALREYVKQ